MQPRAPRDLGYLTARPFAHRGLHAPGGPPENSFAAFAAAIDAGHGIELDVRLTKDRGAVVFHDAELPRLVNASGRIVDLTTAELAAYRIAGSDEPIRSLREAIEFIGGRAPTLIEVKSPGRYGWTSLCRAIRRAIEGANGWVAVMSFDPRIVRWFRHHSPLTVRGLVVSERDRPGPVGWLRRRLAIRAAHPHFLAYDVAALPSGIGDWFRASGRPLLTWTVRTADERRRAAAHADQIIFERGADTGP
jgi:glycerophosphoryl diester phosphodiesterase